MNIYYPTASESRKNSKIQNSNINYRRFAYNRKLEYANFHLNSFGEGPYTPQVIIMRGRVSGEIAALRTALATRDSDLGQVTVDASLYDDKMLELPILREKLKPIVRKAYKDDTTIFEYLFVTGDAFEIGSQENIQTICEEWIIRLGSRPLVPEALSLVTEWAGELKIVLETKEHKKGNVVDDRVAVEDCVDRLFDGLRKNYGDLYITHSADIRPLLLKFDPTFLKPDKKDLSKLNSKQRNLVMDPDQIATVDYSGLVPKNYFMIDNTKNLCDALIFVSVETPTGVPEYAFLAPKGEISKCDIPDIGPRYPKKISCKFTKPLVSGTVKITVKRKR